MTIRSLPAPILVMLAAIGVGAPSILAQMRRTPGVPPEALARISPSRGKAHVDYLASDAMMGRSTPSPELDSAAEYIARGFAAAGFQPVADGYFHRYHLKGTELGSPNTLSVNGRRFELQTGFIPYEHSASGRVSGEVVFVGYGVTRDDGSYDDYAGIDVRGKIVLAITGSPPFGERESRWSQRENSSRRKMTEASRRGAAALLILAHPAQTTVMTPEGYPWRAFYPGVPLLPAPLALDLPQEISPIPSVGISGNAAGAIVGDSLARVASLIRMIDSSGRPRSTRLGGRLELEVTIDEHRVPLRNVVAMIPGRVHPEEFVVIGAHYDHVGHAVERDEKNRPVADTIYNGADDNASGTAALLLLAEALGGLPPEERPARSIMLIAFSGEEQGLLGSRAYVATPLVPNERIVLMINMDMIARNSPDSISVGGWSRSKTLKEIAEIANRAEPMKLGYDLEAFFARSDQASFASRGIPAMFLSSGLHEDYHRVTDSPEKIDAGKLAHVARFCLRLAWMVAEHPGRPDFADE